MERPLALVVDRDPAVRAVIRDVFEEHNVMVLGAGSGSEAREFLKSRPIGIVMADFETPGLAGLDLLARGRELQHAPTVVGILPGAEQQRATELLRSGAFDILFKPVDEQSLQRTVHRTLVQRETLDVLSRLREELQSREGYHGLVGRSAATERLRERLRELGPAGAGVWLVGETGTGKELSARTVHGLSPRAKAAFIVVACGDLDAHGWEARWSGPDGILSLAEGGTVYLADVPELTPELQERLLALLSPGSERHGIRFIASSRTDPAEAVEQGRLLGEIPRAIGGETLVLAPLRDRTEDIPLLARHFISAICEINYLPAIQLAPDALTLMERHHWPANVHELRNAMEQAAILSADGKITARELPDGIRESAALRSTPSAVAVEGVSTRGFREAKREIVEIFERGYLRELMERHGGNVTVASQQAGMLRSALQRLLRKYGLKSAEFRDLRRTAAPVNDAARIRVD